MNKEEKAQYDRLGNKLFYQGVADGTKEYKTIIRGAIRFYVERTHDVNGNRYAEQPRELVVCGDCGKLNKEDCPLKDADKEMDYCSRFQYK